MLGRVSHSVPPLRTARLSLGPVTATLAHAILAGDLSGLSAAPGWPHEHTTAGLAHAARPPPAGLAHGRREVICDCGSHGPADERGYVEIGYGLAAPYRGRGFGSEAVTAMTAWLLTQPDIARVRACTAAGNMASRVSWKAGYRLADHDKNECTSSTASESITGAPAYARSLPLLPDRPPAHSRDEMRRSHPTSGPDPR